VDAGNAGPPHQDLSGQQPRNVCHLNRGSHLNRGKDADAYRIHPSTP
jgi:hypothetical protein